MTCSCTARVGKRANQISSVTSGLDLNCYLLFNFECFSGDGPERRRQLPAAKRCQRSKKGIGDGIEAQEFRSKFRSGLVQHGWNVEQPEAHYHFSWAGFRFLEPH